MEKTLILYPALFLIFLTLFLYVKNYLDNMRALKENNIKGDFFKTYKGDVPDYIDVSRQTLKNQFELPILFYFLVSLVIVFDNVSIVDIIFSWIFVISRYIHCYVRLKWNYIPWRAKSFLLGLFSLLMWWINFIITVIC